MSPFRKIITSWLFITGVIFSTSGQKIDSSFITHIVQNNSSFTRKANQASLYRVSHQHKSKISGALHTYLQQTLNGYDIIEAVASVHIDSTGKLVALHDRKWLLISELKKKDNSIDISKGFELLKTHLNIDKSSTPLLVSIQNTVDKQREYKDESLSYGSIKTREVYVLDGKSLAKCIEFSFEDKTGEHWWNIAIDTDSGRVVSVIDWTVSCRFEHDHNESCKANEGLFMPPSMRLNMASQYNVYPLPIESPSHGSRSIIPDPQDLLASPYGWHDDNGIPGADYTTTKGNNVEARDDIAGDNEATIGAFANGGSSLNFDFPLNFSNHPYTNRDPYITNTFFWSNAIHDVFHYYGFDEAAGNFQQTNYSGDGLGSDFVIADVMDGNGRGNANFSTPPDGSKPRMQMYIWDATGTSNSFQVTSPTNATYSAFRANFGSINYSISGQQIVRTAPTNACSVLTNATAINGKIALIDRSSSCGFGFQCLQAQNAGAIAAVVCNNATGSAFIMSGGANWADVTIPVVMLSQANCNSIKTQLNNNQTVIANMSATVPTPYDSDLDNGVIAHEYGHGISNRLTGGAGNTGCLGNTEQMGEGWSDYFGLMTTMKASDTGTTARGIGTYVLGQATTGNGIRQYKYTTNMVDNPHTYNSIITAVAPHGTGSVWCAMLWEMTWKLIDLYGFDPDLYNGDGGNNIAMKLVVEGMKLQPCSPGFVDGRDAILLADQLMYDGAHQCLIWEAFAKRGLGYGATQGSTNSKTDGVENFSLSPSCYLVSSIISDKSTVIEKDTVTYSIKVKNVSNTILTNVIVRDTFTSQLSFVSASNGGTSTNNVVIFPASTIAVGDSIIRTFKVRVPYDMAGGLYSLDDGAEVNMNNWTQRSTVPATGTWSRVSTSPHTESFSFFAPNPSSSNELYLTLNPLRQLRSNSELQFWHNYNTEEDWDGGRVQISTDFGASWNDLGAYMTQNGYNGILDDNAGSPGFSGNSGGYILTKVNLSSFAGENVLIRFWMHCDVTVGGVGWHIDDISISQMQVILPNKIVTTSTQSISFINNHLEPVKLNNCQVVTSLDDNGEGSLRFAINCAEVGDTVYFAQHMASQVLNLTSPLTVSDDIFIKSTYSPNPIITSTTSPVIDVLSTGSLYIAGVTVMSGSNISPRLIRNEGLLKCQNVTFIDTYLNGGGQSILNLGTIEILGFCVLKL